MNPIEWSSLSEEEKAALIDICKEDPVVFIETICGIELLECQKEIVRKAFKAANKPKKEDCHTKLLYKPNKLIGTKSTSVFVDEELYMQRR